MDKKIIQHCYRAHKRIFSSTQRATLFAETKGTCSHPICDSRFFDAREPVIHHLIQHCRGGSTIVENGLLVCDRCHRLFHDGFVPRRLAFTIKGHLHNNKTGIPKRTDFSAEHLIYYINDIKKTSVLPNEKFKRLNNIIIYANFLPTELERYHVFIYALFAKASVLNDGVSPLRSTLDHMLVSMNYRRRWAQLLAAKAFRYACQVKDYPAMVHALHVRSVCYNARSRPKQAATEFGKALNHLEASKSMINKEKYQLLKARLLREKGVCLAKNLQTSTKAEKEIIKSFEISKAVGEPHNIDDSLIRCAEGYIYLDNVSKASLYLDKLYNNWPRMDANLKVITMKMAAKIELAKNKMENAEEIINRGAEWSSINNLHHQSYHFARLNSHIKLGLLDGRRCFIT